MKLLFAELKKLRQNRICLACLAGLVLVNLFLLWTRVRPLEGRAPAAAYRAIARELDGLSAEEQLALVEQQLEQTSALYKIEQILRVAAASAQGGDTLDRVFVRAVWRSLSGEALSAICRHPLTGVFLLG